MAGPLVLASALSLSLLTTPLVRGLCRRWRLHDFPWGDALKIHRSPVPRLGGLAVALSVFGAMLLGSHLLGGRDGSVPSLLVPGLLVTVLGAVDDLRGLRPSYRLAGHLVAATLLISAGGLVSPPDRSPYLLLAAGFGLLAATNAMNLLDGLDGLAAGVAALAAAGFLALAAARDDGVSQTLALATLGASVGFLPYNFNPASIFLGDCGSTLLGFLLGTLMGRSWAAARDLSGTLAPLFVMGVPLFDTSLAIGRRLVRRRPLFVGDRSHFYDWLVQRGLTQRAAVGLCYGLAALGSWAALVVAR
jgi:UDP-GlcNAc:undecaprenyl-phosphate GlcNAc-1-phosphate transferase